LGDGVGVAIDTYHVWWDPDLEAQIARAGAGNRIFAYHICDWLVPTRDLLLDRGMMGDGSHRPAAHPRLCGEGRLSRPYRGGNFFGGKDWWTRPGDEVLRTCIERYNSVS
jgi:hypothetical protein